MKKYFNSPLNRFRTIAFLEGISFLILLFIAMPLKYAAGMPAAVKFFGMVHGILFVLFIAFLYEVREKHQWSLGKSAIAFLASLIPCGTFWLDKQLLKEAANKPLP